MSPAIILGVAVLAGLFCPLHMWWSHRRGRQAACCPAVPMPAHLGDIELLRARQDRLSALIAAHDGALVASADPDQVPADSPRG